MNSIWTSKRFTSWLLWQPITIKYFVSNFRATKNAQELLLNLKVWELQMKERGFPTLLSVFSPNILQNRLQEKKSNAQENTVSSQSASMTQAVDTVQVTSQPVW